MNLTFFHNRPIDPFAAWQSANDTEWCERLSATITHVTCKENQLISVGDLRCRGCGGLDNQEQLKQNRPALALVWDADQMLDKPPVTDAASVQDAGLAVLDSLLDDLYSNPLDGDDFDDVELDLDDETLLKLFPELSNDEDEREIEQNYANFTAYQESVPRYPVYKGRCRQCGGYMDNTRERHDDNVFRCLACGWRTSPEYERNRTIHAAGGVMI